MREATLELYVRAWVRSRGGWTLKLGGEKGVPDRVVCVPGHPPFFIEFKSPRGRLSKVQQHMIGEIEKAGGKVYVVHSIREFFHEFNNGS